MHCPCGTNNRAPRWTFTDPCKLEVRPGLSFTNVRKILKNISTNEVLKSNLKIRTKCFTNVLVRIHKNRKLRIWKSFRWRSNCSLATASWHAQWPLSFRCKLYVMHDAMNYVTLTSLTLSSVAVRSSSVRLHIYVPSHI